MSKKHFIDLANLIIDMNSKYPNSTKTHTNSHSNKTPSQYNNSAPPSTPQETPQYSDA